MSDDLISREWLEDAFDNLCCHNCKTCRNFRMEDSFYRCALIDNAPTIEERPKGKWKYNPECVNNADVPEFSCSECDVAMGKYFNFCANCGADMRGEENGKNIAMLTLADSLKEKYGKENDNAD